MVPGDSAWSCSGWHCRGSCMAIPVLHCPAGCISSPKPSQALLGPAKPPVPRSHGESGSRTRGHFQLGDCHPPPVLYRGCSTRYFHLPKGGEDKQDMWELPGPWERKATARAPLSALGCGAGQHTGECSSRRLGLLWAGCELPGG